MSLRRPLLLLVLGLLLACGENAPAGSPNVVCLLPARDCAHLLPGWFESVARFADVVRLVQKTTKPAFAETPN